MKSTDSGNTTTNRDGLDRMKFSGRAGFYRQYNRFRSIGLVMAVVFAFLAAPALALDYYFVAAGNWSNTASWSLSSNGSTGVGPPISGDTVTFDSNSGACTLDIHAAANTIILDTGYTYTVSCGAKNLSCTDLTINAGILDIGTATLAIGGGGSVTIVSTGSLTATGGTIECNGTFNLNSGTFNAPSGTMYMAGNLTMLSGSIFNHNNGTIIFDGGIPVNLTTAAKGLNNVQLGDFAGTELTFLDDVVIEGNLTIGGGGSNSIDFSNRKLTLAGTTRNWDLSDITSMVAAGSTLEITGDITMYPGPFPYNAIVIGAGSGGALTMSGAMNVEGSFKAVPGGVTSVDLGSNAFSFGGALFDIAALATFTASSTDITFDHVGLMTVNPGTHSFSMVTVASGNNVILGADLNIDSSLTVQVEATLFLNGFDLNQTTGTFSNEGVLRLVGIEGVIFEGTAVMDTDSGTVEYVGNGDGNQDTYSIADFGAGADYYDLIVNIPDDLDIMQMSVSLLVANNLTIKAGVLSACGNSIEVWGNFENQGFLWLTGAEPAVCFSSGNDIDSGTTVYTGLDNSVGESWPIREFGDPDYFNITFDGGTDPDTFAPGSPITVAADLIANGTILNCGNEAIMVVGSTTIGVGASVEIANGSFDANGPFDASAGGVNFIGTGSLRLAGTMTGFGSFTAGPGTVIYDGTGQTVIGGVIYANLEIGGAGTMVLVSGATVEGNLILTSGNLALGGSDLHMGTSSGVAGSPYELSHVVIDSTGVVKKFFDGPGTTFSYPVGDGTYYTPLSLTFNSGIFAPGAYVAAGVAIGKHPSDPSTTEYIARHWPVTVSGVSAYSCDLLAMYGPTDVVGSEANISAAVLGVTWEVFDTIAGALTASGVSALGDVAGLATPVIGTVTPDNGPRAGGNQLTITGANLGNGFDITAVTLCGAPAASIDSQDVDQVTVTAGDALGFIGPGDVEVTSTTFGTTVLAAGYIYNPGGVITEVTPSAGPFQGGTVVIIRGANLCDGTDVTQVTLCGAPATSINYVGSTEIEVITASAGVGPGDVVVTSTSYGETIRVNGFIYTATYHVSDAGDDSDGFTWATAFTTIQAAISAASPKDTIMVGSAGTGHGSGHYNENITIDKPLTIDSETGYDNTVLVGPDSGLDVVTIASDGVRLRGLRIYGATAYGMAAIRADGKKKLRIENISTGDNADPLKGNSHGLYISNCESVDIVALNAQNSGDAHILVRNSSKVSLSHCTARGGTDGIRIETSSHCSIGECSLGQGSGNGITLVSTFDSTVVLNKVSEFSGNGIMADNSAGNTIFLNSIKGGVMGNAAEAGSSSNIWNSPAAIHYDFRSGGFFEGPLGNFYGDGDHAGPGGVSITPYSILPGVSTDSFQLTLGGANRWNYDPQTWILSGNALLTRGDFGDPVNGVTIEPGKPVVFSTPEALEGNLTFPPGNWEISVVFTAPPVFDAFAEITVEIGCVESLTPGSSFTSEAATSTMTDGFSSRFNFAIDSPIGFDVQAGRYLALRVSSTFEQNLHLLTGGGFSFVSSPAGSPEYSLLPYPSPPEPLMTDDVADTLAWNYLGRFPNFGDYEFSLDGGVTWSPCASNPLPIGPGLYQDVRLRVRSGLLGAARPAGVTAHAFTAFTALPTLGTVAVTPNTFDAGVTIEVVDDGGGLFEAGVCWDTAPAPTTSANRQIFDFTGPGFCFATIFDLSPGMTYYARTYAINGSGTAYGVEGSFTTNSPPVPASLAVSGPEDGHLAITLAAFDVDCDPLTYYIDSLPIAGTIYQTLDGATLGFPIITTPDMVTNPGGMVIFVPPVDEYGHLVVSPAGATWQWFHSSFGFSVWDGFLSVSSGVTIEITPIPDTPVIKAAVSTARDTSTAPIIVSPNFADGSEVTHFRISGITNGSVTVAVFNAITAVPEGGFITAADGASGLVFTPSTGFSGTGSFLVEASMDGSTVTSQTNVATCTITVIETNTAPVVNKTVTPYLIPIYDIDTANSGTTVAAILASGGVGFASDIEQGTSLGIAVTGVESSIGSWDYSKDGTSWTPVGYPRVQGALLLSGTWWLRFVPALAPERTLYSASVTFKAWDMVTGKVGQTGVDTSFFNSGGFTSFSTDVATAYVTVHPKKFTLTMIPAQVAENTTVQATCTVSVPLRVLTDLGVILFSGSLDQATVPANVVITAGSSSATFKVTPVNDKLADGPAGVEITASAAGWASGKASITITDDDDAAIAISMATTFSEKSGTQSGTVKLLSSSASFVTVSLTSSNPLRVMAPQSVVIPVGSLAAAFSATIADNGAIDGDEDIVITGSALGWTPATLTVRVTDDEKKTVSVTVTRTLREGLDTVAGAGTVMIGGTLAADLAVALTSSNTDKLVVPEEILVKAGTTSAIFDIIVIDDTLEDGQTLVDITPSATGFIATALSVSVQDDDATNQLVISAPIRLNEGIGLVTGQCSVTRYGSFDAVLVVTLVSRMPSVLTVSGPVSIPSGFDSATFDITVLDDDLVGTSKSVIITASASGWISGNTVITVLEDDQLKIDMVLAAKLMAGAGEVASAGTASISGKQSGDLPVTLTSLDTDYISVPRDVTIPAGSLSAMFPVTVLVPASTQGAHTVRIKAESPGFSSTVAETVVFEPPKAELGVVVFPVGKTGVIFNLHIDPNVRTETISQAARFDSVTISLDPTLFTFSTVGTGDGFANATARDLSGGDLLAASTDGAPAVILDVETNTLTLRLKEPVGLSDSPYLRPMVVSFSGVTASNPTLDANGTVAGTVSATLDDSMSGLHQQVLPGDGDGGSDIFTGTLTYLLRESILPPVTVSYAEVAPNRLILKPGVDNEVTFTVHVRIPAVESNWSPSSVSGTGINEMLLKFPEEMTVNSISVKTSGDGGQPGGTPPVLTSLVKGADYFESTNLSVAGSRIFRFANPALVADGGADALAIFEVRAVMPGTGTSFRVPALLGYIQISGSDELRGPAAYVTSGDADGVASNANTNIVFLSMESKRPVIASFTARDFFMGTPGLVEAETRVVSKARLSIEANDPDSVFGFWLFWSVADLTGTEALAEISNPSGRLRGINRTPFIDARRSGTPKIFEIDWNVAGLYENAEVFPPEAALESVPVHVYAFAYDGARPTEAELPALMVRGATRIVVVKPDPDDQAPGFAFTTLAFNEVLADLQGPLKFRLADDRQGLVKVLFYHSSAPGDTRRAKPCKDSSGGHLAGSLQPFVGILSDSRVYQVNWDTSLVQAGAFYILARVTDGGHPVTEYWTRYPVRVSHSHDDIAPTFEWIAPAAAGTLTPVTAAAFWSYRVLDGDNDTLSVTLFLSPVMVEGDDLVQLSASETLTGTLEFVTRSGSIDMSGYLGGAYYLLARIEQPLKAVPMVLVWTSVPILVDRASGIGNLAVGNPYPDTVALGRAAVTVTFTTSRSAIPEIRYGVTGVLDKNVNGPEGFDHSIALTGLMPGGDYRFSVHASTASGDEFFLDNGGRNYRLVIPSLAVQTPDTKWIRGRVSPEDGVLVRLYVVRNPGSGETMSRRFVTHPDSTGAWSADIGGAVEGGGDARAMIPVDSDCARVEIVTRGGRNVFIDKVPLAGITAAVTLALAIAPEKLGGNGQGLEVLQTAYAHALVLPKGFSLVSVPMEPVTPMTSKSFMDLAGSDCVALYFFDVLKSSYSMLAKSGDGCIGTDFPIRISDGFFVKMNADATIEIMVNKLQTPKTHAVQKGFNLIGLPFSANFPADGRTGLTAFGLLRSLRDDGIAIYAFDNGFFRIAARVGYDKQGEPIFHPPDGDFEITTGMGVFVKTIERSSFRGEGE